MDGFVSPEPGELPLGIVAGGLLDRLLRLLDGAPPFQGGQELLIANGLQRRGAGGQAPGQQALDLLQKALPEHALHPQVNPAIQLPPVRKIQSQPAGPVPWRDASGLQIVLGQGLSRLPVHLQGPDDPLFVRRVQPGRPCWVHPPELLQEGLRPLLAGPSLQRPPQFRVRVRRKIVTPNQRIHIETGAPCQDGSLAPGQNVRHHRSRKAHKFPHGHGLLRLCHIQHVVRHAPAFFQSRLGCANVHMAVDLH